MNALTKIRAIDYTIIFARDMPAMRAFYENVLGFPLRKELGPQWVEYAVGSQILTLTEHGMMWNDTPTPEGQLSLQLAFRVTPDEVNACAEELEAKGIALALPVTDQPWGHRTVFFRDPDGNLLEIYADI
ncbi:VOC family protein [Pseudooceanicola sp. C21-150M6]|uniref:VOC family protein n=1 Tax=Pseudooceanicola sp. C21-150M6 TaxID=3434355 RepID=UPI003D7FB619